MNKLIVYTVTAIAALGILTSCAQESKNADLQRQSEVPSTSTAAPQNQQMEEKNTDSFKTGVFVDLDAMDDPLFNDEIKALLKTTLESLANKDEQGFRSVFQDEQVADAYMYLFGRDYYFDKYEGIEKDNSNRIVVNVTGKDRYDGEIHNPNSAYYFIQDKSGQWKLGVID
ncbi:hypothetical protein GNQ08_26085 [Paenibacillus macerans]|uniref:Lipoprotein n=1 Tax=Paenibacillus macerans TaxID=44252 RepID=A0A6N8F1M5_PAEMA|nr:hypothetical protein [Paenibacillus macerans]MED4957620.1 hypothetical protein [Paenibacillus macerans]MUG25835.1 hypothetical protein [Paenibacillus macerans]UMV50687.1 hypothetical protein LMZ02_15625 [Paenibacillus macerans]